MGKPEIEPITDETLAEFAAFLSENLTSSRSPQGWAEALRVDWGVERPNYGFMLRDRGEVVGGIGAYYSEQIIRGRAELFCNVTSWAVLEKYRSHSARLAVAMTSQPGFHFTNFSPTNVVMGVLKFLKFKQLDDRQLLVFNPACVAGRGRVLHAPDAVTGELSGNNSKVYHDHAQFPWLRQVLVGEPGAWCHVIYKRDRSKCAAILHLSDAGRFNTSRAAFFRHVLTRRMIRTRVEYRLVKERYSFAEMLTGYNPKLFRSETLGDDDITRLYSETMALQL